MELDPQTILEQIASSIQASVPGLELRGVLGEVRLGAEIFPDYEGDPSERVPPDLKIQELGMDFRFNGEHHGANAWASADTSIERWAGFAENTLSEIQDIIAMDTHEPWPEMLDNGKRSMALPQAAVRDGALWMWFGDEANPILCLAPVRLTT